MDQKASDISVAAFAYATKALLSPTWSLLWNEAKPGGKLTAGFELSRIADRGDDGACRNWADAGNALEPAASWICVMPRQELYLNLTHACGNFLKLFSKNTEHFGSEGW